jgi:hypothetical protein
MEAFLDRLLGKTPAQIAGKKAARSWMKILDQTDEDIETLTGRDLFTHAQGEARKWLRSTYSFEKHGLWTREDERQPEQKRHGEFLEYVEAFISQFPPVSRGYPKE